MTDPFDWHVGEEEEDALPIAEEATTAPGWFWFNSAAIVAITAVILLFILSGYRTGQRQLENLESNARTLVQAQLDLQAEAIQNGDGELFFSLHEDNTVWRAAQLLPENVAFYRANPKVTRTQTTDNRVWANVSAGKQGGKINRIMFFVRQPDGTIQQVATDPAFWGGTTARIAPWGTLRIQSADKGWADQVEAFVQNTIDARCAEACLKEKTTFRLNIGTGYDETAAPDQINIPSPRLVALDDEGEPADIFWQMLEQRVVRHITPATIRFGVPVNGLPLIEYESAVEAFMAENPDIIVELVPLPSRDPTEIDHEGLDGATLFPTESMLADGTVRNLTDYLLTDSAFEHKDFYEQIWQSAWWQHQFWLVPQAGQMRLLFYDRTAYQKTGHPEPSLRWSWSELERDMDIFANSDIHADWGLLDSGNDLLFSHAYNVLESCEQPSETCSETLTPDAIEAALTWYAAQSGEPGHIPDMSRLKLDLPVSIYDREARGIILSNWQSVQRRAVIWVDDSERFELAIQLGPMGIVPFPGSDRFDGTTPMWMYGHIVYQQSERPLATWRFISFLSRQHLASRFRYVPARSSVAVETQFWARLPQQLSDPMRTAIPFARPVLIEEQHYFSWDVVTAVVSGDLTPAQAAKIDPEPDWFGANK